MTTETNTLQAIALTDIAIADTQGDVVVDQVTTQGVIDLSVVGSILDDGDLTAGADLSGSQINLLSQTGSVGTTVDGLEIDATGQSAGFSATALGDIVVTDVAADLSTGQITSISGDILLTLPDQVTKGQDLAVTDGSVIRAIQGDVTLDVGDNVTLAADSQVTAAQAVTIAADTDPADPDATVGASVDLSGTIQADTVEIQTGADGDRVSLTNTQPGVATTILTGDGKDIIHLGSAATPTSNTGGTLETFDAIVDVQSGNGNDALILDDSGDTTDNSGEIAATQVTGFGLKAGITYSDVEDLTVNLGSGDDTITATSTVATGSTLVDGGLGDDAGAQLPRPGFQTHVTPWCESSQCSAARGVVVVATAVEECDAPIVGFVVALGVDQRVESFNSGNRSAKSFQQSFERERRPIKHEAGRCGGGVGWRTERYVES